jgi:glycosyltransferase involved in cell wall biosynthesis
VTLGQRRGHELAEIYRNAGCFALSSDQEGLAIVILEAMASGLPVVSTRCGGPEMLVQEGETGYFSAVNNAQHFAQRLECVVKDCTMQKRFGLKARDIAERHYSLTAASKPFLDAIHECLPS